MANAIYVGNPAQKSDALRISYLCGNFFNSNF